MPERTTSIIIERTWRAARRETARRRTTLSSRAMRGTARRPSAAIVAATLAIASGVARSFSCPIAAEPTARSSSSAARRRDGAALGGGDPRRLAEAERTRRGHQPAGAELGAQRREHRVAGLGERLLQRASARLAAGVAQRHAGEGRGRLHGVARRRLDDPAVERRGRRDDLERRAGRLRRRDREAGEREHRAVARAEHGHAPDLAAERGLRGARQAGVEERPHRLPAHRLGAGDLALAEHQPRGGVAAEAVVVHALQARRLVARAPGDRRPERRGVEPAPVRGEDRRASRRAAGLAHHRLVAAQAGHAERVVPVHARLLAAAGDRDGERAAQGLEHVGADRDRDGDPPVRARRRGARSATRRTPAARWALRYAVMNRRSGTARRAAGESARHIAAWSPRSQAAAKRTTASRRASPASVRARHASAAAHRGGEQREHDQPPPPAGPGEPRLAAAIPPPAAAPPPPAGGLGVEQHRPGTAGRRGAGAAPGHPSCCTGRGGWRRLNVNVNCGWVGKLG